MAKSVYYKRLTNNNGNNRDNKRPSANFYLLNFKENAVDNFTLRVS